MPLPLAVSHAGQVLQILRVSWFVPALAGHMWRVASSFTLPRHLRVQRALWEVMPQEHEAWMWPLVV